MEMKFCQSCGMPLQSDADYGTNRDGSKNEEYCVYCYQKGAFTFEGTMDEMIQKCAEFADSFKDENGKSYTREEAIAFMNTYFPHLKRWKK